MARTGRPRGKKFETYLPQTACTDDMYEKIKAIADRDYDGNIGAVIRVGAQCVIDQNKEPEPAIIRQVEYRHIK